jgi:hypothetical protein
MAIVARPNATQVTLTKSPSECNACKEDIADGTRGE